MKKIVLLPLFVITCSLCLHAQVRLGLLGGLHTSNVLETNNIKGWDTAVKKYQDSRSGFQLGLIMEVPLGNSGLFFQPAITYTTKGRRYNRNYDSLTALATDTIYHKQSLNLGYIEIPLNLTYKLPLTANHTNFFILSAGPYFSFFNNGNITIESLTQKPSKYNSTTNSITVGKGPDTYRTTDIGVNGRAGFELGNVMITGYYSRGLTNFYTASYTGTFHHEVLGASLAIWLSSTSAPKPLRKKDTDLDGVMDAEDRCPLQPGTLARLGCPAPDSDHDGVDDDHDSCRTVRGSARYNGCPIPDTDHDGVDDDHDSCKTVAGLARYHGCPIPDRDGDGINDEEDKCPDSAGTAANHGCPVIIDIRKETTEKINYIARNILFQPGSDHLTDSSYLALDELATILLAHTEGLLAIEGYTDNQGSPARNQFLSQKRADAVRDYLVKKGIAFTRLTAKGFGPERPIADNKTAEGRAANRRVELKPTF